jgi:tetratricopeptide (TPR) repeat protein
MKKTILLYFLIGLFCATVAAQKISKPTLTPTEPNEAQKALIQQGIALHDAKKFDEAIAKYRQVLADNPDCTQAMYEMALSYFNKPDSEKALEISFKGTQYKSRELALFYGIIASIWDTQGKSLDAVKLYQDGIKLLKDEKGFEEQLAGLYYNLGVTYARQKKYPEARELLKNAVELNFGYASPNYMLAEIFYGTKYKVPAVLAAARLISLELNSARTKRSVLIFLDVLKAAKKDEQTGNINIFLDMNAPKDEGEFAMYDLLLGTLTAVRDEKEKDKSDEEVFAGAIDTFIAILEEDKKLSKTFVGKTYIPFMAEMKKKGYSKVLAYMILQQNGNKTAEKWLVENNQLLTDFVNWSKTYKPAKK